MTTIELYTKGARVWVPNPQCVWEGAEVIDNYKDGAGKLRVQLDSSGKVVELPLTGDAQLPPLRNPDILVGENDLTSLSYLHEPAVLHNLCVRFCRHNDIYTYCGIVLVAINPYSELPIYGGDTVWTYRGQSMGDLDPHIFAVAEEAYTKLEREQRDQSIIVSGESGAGKTVSAKYAMRYFAIVGGSSTETQVEKKVLASSPIMEAIGNAKTTRNDNSSRFGKYIEIHFDKAYHIVGASMRTYLLEKSRVVFQAPEERNYHVFYQLCASRDQYSELKLAHPDEFVYLNQGGAATIDGVDDAKSFQDMVAALTLLGFGVRERSDMWRILAAVLHLGNVHILPNAEGSTISTKDLHLSSFCELLEVDIGEMRTWLCQRRIVSVRETLNTPMNVTEATAARDALAKHIYAELFNWIVGVVNKALESGTNTRQKFIGVLDIYGFETFEINSFEQFCINYANEKLQQQFNQHVFKLEQEEYLKEEIEWKFIDFYDNQPCIDLIETRLGILDLLDEECRMPKGKDSSWAEKLYSQCAKWKHFSKPRFGTTAFLIKHFADNVQYEVSGFLEKNRDTVMEEQITVLRGGQNKLVQKLFADEARRLMVPASRVKVQPAVQTQSQSKQNKKTVGSQFRDSLNKLMSTLNATTPHYIRCIKPNDNKKPFEYNPIRAVQQLRACGVLETIRISAAGFPSRWTYQDFFLRYRVLCRTKDINYDSLPSTCGSILNNFIKDEDKYKFGKTKLFFRAGQVAYLEKLRGERLRICCIRIQAHVRGFLARTRYLRKRHAASTIQRWVRGFLARRRVYHMRRERASTIIQKRFRGWIKRHQYQRLRCTIFGIQRYARGLLGRRKYMEMRQNHAATVIQTAVRGWLCRKQYTRSRRHVVIAQSAVRRFLAKRKCKALKREARSVEHVKKLNKGLENKIISLQQKIEELNKENNSLKSVHNDLNELRQRYDSLKGIEAEFKRVSNLLIEKDTELEKLHKDLQQERDEKMDLMHDEEHREKERKETEIRLGEENKLLKDQLNAANEQIKLNQSNTEELIQLRLEQEKQILIREQDQDRSAYQKLLRDFHALEQRSDLMEKELARIHREGGNLPSTLRKNKHHRTPSSASTMSMQDDAASVSSEVPDDVSTDYGYGSVRSSTPAQGHTHLGNIDWSQTASPESVQNTGYMAPSDVDVGLVLKLQTKLKEVIKERDRVFRRLDALDQNLTDLSEVTARTQDSFRVQELEIENEKLRRDLAELRSSIAKGNSGAQQLLSQYKALELELERRREECIELHTVLANQTTGMKNIARSSYGRDVDIINEDGELVLAFEAQKKINRQLEDELQAEKEQWRIERKELLDELDRLRNDNEQQQNLLTANLSQGPTTPAQAYLQHEISRLTAENLELQEKCAMLTGENRKLCAQLKSLKARIKDAGMTEPQYAKGARGGGETATAPTKSRTQQPPQPAPRGVDSQNRKTQVQEQSALPIVRKKDHGDREYLGMFEYSREDEQIIVTRLINELKPSVAMKLLPGLPAYILMMCIRHIDYINDDEKVRSLLTAIINTVKKLIRRKHDDLEVIVLWLSNVLRLLHNMKQYSGEKTFQEENTHKQNEQCLRNFDLAEYRQVLSDTAVWIYQAVITMLEERVQPLVVPAILEHEAITGFMGRSGGGAGRRGRSMSSTEVKPGVEKALDRLLTELTSFYRTLGFHGVDPEVVTQVFKQLFYFICASALNNLLLRKDLCHWSKGMQIRYNLSHLESWTRDHNQDPSILDMLQPIIQAAQLLQARKSDQDVQSVCEMCDRLTVHQIIKLLNLYTPIDEYEERVPLSFTQKVQAFLQEKAKSQDKSEKGEVVATLLMDSKSSFPVRFPFNPSNIRLEDIEVPDVLNLPMLKKV